MPSNQQVIFVGGMARTGGTYAAALLDGHPSITAVPGDFTLINNGAIDAEFFNSTDTEQMIAQLVKGRIQRGELEGQRKGKIQPYHFDFGKYLATITGQLGYGAVDIQNFLYILGSTWIECCDEFPPRPLKFIALHGGQDSYQIKNIVDAAKIGAFVYTRRDSLTWLASYLKRLETDRIERRGIPKRIADYVTDTDIQTLLLLKSLQDNRAVYLSKAYPKSVFVVDYENLVESPIDELATLIKTLGLDSHESLGVPTQFGGTRQAVPNTSFDSRSDAGKWDAAERFFETSFSSQFYQRIRENYAAVVDLRCEGSRFFDSFSHDWCQSAMRDIDKRIKREIREDYYDNYYVDQLGIWDKIKFRTSKIIPFR